MPRYGKFKYNKKKYNQGGDSFLGEIDKLNDTIPRTKIEFVETDGTATDVSQYYVSGGTVERIKERAPDEIQAGDFDIVFLNTDDFWSEYVSGSFLSTRQYHGAQIKVYAGFELSDGTVEYVIQQRGYIDQLVASDTESKITFRCRDIIRALLDQKLHARFEEEIPVPGEDNVGNGTCSAVETRPFSTVDETWTLTCTTAGANGVAQFSVVGSSTGSVGPATSGTEFSGTQIKFTIRAGTSNWDIGDSFTFQTFQHPEWNLVNPAKIIWEVLTGYDWDTDTVQNWAASVLGFDHTQSSANTDLDYTSFSETIQTLADIPDVKGAIWVRGQDATEFLQGLLIQFLGALYTEGDGRIKIQAYRPTFEAANREYADDKKISRLGYTRSVEEIINAVRIKYRSLPGGWDLTGDSDPNIDGQVVMEDTVSQARYDQAYQFDWTLDWYSVQGQHAVDLASQLLSKYSDPPLNIDFVTGSDGLLLGLGDRIRVSDEKYGFSEILGEVVKLTKNIGESPLTVSVRARREADADLNWGFLGSSADEGDGLSPQNDDFDSASASDKLFAYQSQTGGEGTPPDYRMF